MTERITQNLTTVALIGAAVWVFRDTIGDFLPGDVFGSASADTIETASGAGTYGHTGAYLTRY